MAPSRHPPLGDPHQQSIQSWIDTWNDDPRPFVWSKTADEILDTIAAYCQRINDSGHSPPADIGAQANAEQDSNARGQSQGDLPGRAASQHLHPTTLGDHLGQGAGVLSYCRLHPR
jgi:hypothetical protein